MIALVTLWMIGIHVAGNSYTAIQVLTDPWFSGFQLSSGLEDVFVKTMREHYDVLLPLSIAQLLIAGLLVVLSAVAVFAGRLSLMLALQTIGVMAALSIGSYVAEQPVREARINAQVAENAELMREQLGDQDVDLYQLFWNGERLALMIKLAALVLSGVALSRPRVRHFYAYHAAARANQER